LVLLNLSDNQGGANAYRRFASRYDRGPPGGTLPGDFAVGLDPSRFNFRAFTPAIPGMEKSMYMVTGRYKIFGDGLQLYGDVMYSHVTQNNGLAGAPFLVNVAAARQSEFNPFGNNLASVRYRSQQELANRRSFFDKDLPLCGGNQRRLQLRGQASSAASAMMRVLSTSASFSRKLIAVTFATHSSLS
jgi:hypothetical protein